MPFTPNLISVTRDNSPPTPKANFTILISQVGKQRPGQVKGQVPGVILDLLLAKPAATGESPALGERHLCLLERGCVEYEWEGGRGACGEVTQAALLRSPLHCVAHPQSQESADVTPSSSPGVWALLGRGRWGQ